MGSEPPPGQGELPNQHPSLKLLISGTPEFTNLDHPSTQCSSMRLFAKLNQLHFKIGGWEPLLCQMTIFSSCEQIRNTLLNAFL
jgi:hypothetical protein